MFRYLKILMLVLGLSVVFCSDGKQTNQVYTGVIEGTIVKVPALTGGKIIQLFFDSGDPVEKGATLAQIDTMELSFQRQNLNGILQEVDNQKLIALTQLERAKKELKYIQEKFRRYEDLLKEESISQQNVDDLKNQLQNAESVYQTALQQIRTVDSKRIQTEAQLSSVRKKIHDARITAPLSGTITDKFYETGEAVPSLAPLAEIIDLNEVWVKIYVSEKQLPHIQTGQKTKIHLDGTEQTLTGTISWISSTAEFTPKTILTPETRTSLVYALKVNISNPDRLLKHGMPVEVHLLKE
ncbi:MAG: efflux RND transporter periplasmic adaptor subunit [bacterium]|nr:MAG: efflux RND transporter periplasmic adaptor subunit [bacterium]